MPPYKAMVKLQKTSLNPEDVIINTFWFGGPGAGTEAQMMTDITTALGTFYQLVDQYFSSNIQTNGNTVTFYDMADGTPRVPVGITTLANLTCDTTALPDEVALCLSFQGDRVSGIPQARLRGRVFLGPLGRAALGAAGLGDRPVAAARTAWANAGDGLLAASAAATNWEWGVFSQDYNIFTPITNGWVDDAFDTQRRRGLRPINRTVWS